MLSRPWASTPDLDFLEPKTELSVRSATATGWTADPLTLETNLPGVFAGGDAFTGPDFGGGGHPGRAKRAAESIHRYP